MKIIERLILSLGLVFLVIAVAIFRPVPIVQEHEAIPVSGTVRFVFEGGVNDVVIKLEGDDRRFYINRGLEYGLDLDDLKDRLIGHQVVMKYPKYWTPLDWNNQVRHISKLEFQGEVLFNELKPD